MVYVMPVPGMAKALIENVVLKDEGGWNLNPTDPNDHDGGWTFGGITSKTYNEFYEPVGEQKPIDRETIELVVKGPRLPEFILECVQIYYQNYYMPMHKLLGDAMYAAELSCAINLGVTAAKTFVNSALHDQDFLNLWANYYVHLVVENAKAWKEYADALEEVKDQTLLDSVQRNVIGLKPKTLRAIYLAGWLARVNRYR